MHLIFPPSKLRWRLDLVGLLTIIGESAVEEIVTELCSTKSAFLPRFVPAPNAMIRPTRTVALATNNTAKIYGAVTGNSMESMPYFADILFPVEFMEPLSVTEVSISYTPGFESFYPCVRLLSPLRLVNIGSALLAIGLLVFAILRRDGPAVVAIVLVSAASAVHSLASFWTPETYGFAEGTKVPPSTVVIRAMNGAFTIVRCNLGIAESLFFSPPKNRYYFGPRLYKIFTTLGAVFHIFGIITIANCTWDLQVALGSSFLLLNGLYLWISMSKRLSRRLHWDFSPLKIRQLTSKPTSNYFTALWSAIKASGSTQWVRENHVTVQNTPWRKWIDKAEAQLMNNGEWDAQGAFRECVIEAADVQSKDDLARNEDENAKTLANLAKVGFEDESIDDEKIDPKVKKRVSFKV